MRQMRGWRSEKPGEMSEEMLHLIRSSIGPHSDDTLPLPDLQVEQNFVYVWCLFFWLLDTFVRIVFSLIAERYVMFLIFCICRHLVFALSLLRWLITVVKIFVIYNKNHRLFSSRYLFGVICKTFKVRFNWLKL